MAYPTAQQADVMLQLGAEHGPPEYARIEHTEEPYGIIWCAWLGHPGLSELNEPSRNLFIKPDGTRLSWDQLQAPRGV